MTMETNAQQLRHKNAKALQLTIEQLERVAEAQHTKKQDQLLRKLTGQACYYSSSFDDDDVPLIVDAYMEGCNYTNNCYMKGSTR